MTLQAAKTTRPRTRTAPTPATAAPEAPPASISGKRAMCIVLAQHKGPLKAKALFAEALPLIVPAPTGRTPLASLSAQAYTEAKKKDGLYTLAAKGTFKLTTKGKALIAE